MASRHGVSSLGGANAAPLVPTRPPRVGKLAGPVATPPNTERVSSVSVSVSAATRRPPIVGVSGSRATAASTQSVPEPTAGTLTPVPASSLLLAAAVDAAWQKLEAEWVTEWRDLHARLPADEAAGIPQPSDLYGIVDSSFDILARLGRRYFQRRQASPERYRRRCQASPVRSRPASPGSSERGMASRHRVSRKSYVDTQASSEDSSESYEASDASPTRGRLHSRRRALGSGGARSGRRRQTRTSLWRTGDSPEVIRAPPNSRAQRAARRAPAGE